MRGRLTSLLLSWPLLLSLATLITNDVYLKYAFPGLLTGKLSDFAGIFLVSYLAFGLWPRWRLASALAIVVLFVYWKSPLSQSLIDAANAVAPVEFKRVVDYWDLLAFFVMPLAAALNRHYFIDRRLSRWRRFASIPIAFVAVIAMTATSIYMPTRAFRIQSADTEYVMDEVRIASMVERIAGNYGATCSPGDAHMPSLDCQGQDLWILYLFDETEGTAQFLVTSVRGAGFFGTEPDQHLLQNVLSELKAEFARMAPDMEYVEALEEDSWQQVAEFIERVCGEDSSCEEE